MRSSSPFIARAVRAITGILRVASSRFSSAVASRPSIPGNWISIRMSCGCSPRASVNPASASVAVSTVCPADCSRKTASVMLAGLSSTISTVAMSSALRPAGHRPAYFGGEAIAIEAVLLHDRDHEAVQPEAVLLGNALGGHDQDGDARRVALLD